MRKKAEFHVRQLSQIDVKTIEKAELEVFFPPKNPVNAKIKAIKKGEVKKESAYGSGERDSEKVCEWRKEREEGENENRAEKR